MRKWIAAGLFLITLALYAQTGSYGFVSWDDPLAVTENEQVLRGLTAESIRWALTTHFVYWQPLVYLSHMAMVSAFGLDGGPHHWLNAILHAANVALLFLILFRLRFPLWTAAVAAALYGWHPLRVESVAWITERRDVLVGLMWLSTIWFYLDYVESGRERRKYWLVAVFCALALMAKPVAVTLPLMLLLLDYWPLGSVRVMEKLPLLGLSAGCAVMALIGQREAGAVSVNLPLGFRLLNAARSYTMYLKQSVWPVDLSPFYSTPPAHPVGEIALSIALLAGITWSVWRYRETRPWLAAAWVWYVVVLAPNIGIIQVGEQAHADRYTYLPAMLLTAGFCYALPRAALYGGAVVSVLFLLMSFAQIQYWKDDFALYGRMIEVEPDSSAGHNNLGFELQRTGRLAEAIPHFAAAAQSPRVFGEARLNAAYAYMTAGQPERALPFAEAAVKASPERAKAYLFLGQALAGVQRFAEAQAAFSKGLERSPDSAVKAQLHMQIGTLHYMAGKDQAALDSFRAVLAANPESALARKNVGIVLGNLGRNQEAVAELEKYLAAQPDDAAVRQAIDVLRAAARIAR
jgi:tetratricopeptide (TPR) repeat protein